MHGAVLLRAKHLTPEQVEAIARDHRDAGLEPREVAMLDLVEKITLNAYKVTDEDVDGLRAHGFSDEEILDIVLATTMRSFISKTLDALGAQPEPEYARDFPILERVTRFER